MSLYALIQNSLVSELFTPPAGAAVTQCFTPEVVAQFVDVSAVNPEPQPGWVATESDGAWTFAPAPPPTLGQVQASALEAIQAAKVRALSSMQYAFEGTTYSVTLSTQDQIDVSTQIQLLTGQPAGSTASWEIVANVFVSVTLADLQSLQTAGIAHVQSVYANTAALVGQVNAATTAAQVQAIDIESGWPA